MCMSVVYRGQNFDNRGELRRLISAEPIWLPEHEPLPGRDGSAYCLCGVDHHQTAALLGCRVDDDGVDIFYLPVG